MNSGNYTNITTRGMESISIKNAIKNETSKYDYTVDDMDYQIERVISIVLPSIFAVIAVLGFIGNLLVIIVVLSNKQMRSPTNVLITNLAMADLTFVMIYGPIMALNYSTHQWSFGKIWCQFITYVQYSTAWASVYTLAVISAFRYLAVVHPLGRRSLSYRTTQNAIICIATLWLVILVVNIPAWLLHGTYEYKVFVTSSYNIENRIYCWYLGNAGEAQIFFTFFFVFGYLLPLLMVCVLYCLMLCRLLYGPVPEGNQSAATTRLRSQKRVTRMVVIVISVFTICWLPQHIVYLSVGFGSEYRSTATFSTWNILANVLMYTNSCVNPFLYAFLSENFRTGFKNILCCNRINTRIQGSPVMEQQKGYVTVIRKPGSAGAYTRQVITKVKDGFTTTV